MNYELPKINFVLQRVYRKFMSPAPAEAVTWLSAAQPQQRYDLKLFDTLIIGSLKIFGKDFVNFSHCDQNIRPGVRPEPRVVLFDFFALKAQEKIAWGGAKRSPRFEREINSSSERAKEIESSRACSAPIILRFIPGASLRSAPGCILSRFQRWNGLHSKPCTDMAE